MAILYTNLEPNPAMWASESDLLKAEATAFRNNHYLLLKLLSKVFLNPPTVVMSKEAGDKTRSFNIKHLCNGNLQQSDACRV